MPVEVRCCGNPGPATKAAIVDIARRVAAPASTEEAAARKSARDHSVAARALAMAKGDAPAAAANLRFGAMRMARLRSPAPRWSKRIARLERAADILDPEGGPR